LGESVKVGDFGLARLLRHDETGHSGSGYTAAYAAPEFFDGRTAAQSDQYSLAVTYCYLRGGRLPFSGTAAQMMIGHVTREPDLSMLPAEERPAVRRALAKQPADRWPTCGLFVAALRQAQAESLAQTPQGATPMPVTVVRAVSTQAAPAPPSAPAVATGSINPKSPTVRPSKGLGRVW